MALETMGIRLANVTTTLDLETALSRLGVRRPDPEDVDLDGSHGPSENDATAALAVLAGSSGGSG